MEEHASIYQAVTVATTTLRRRELIALNVIGFMVRHMSTASAGASAAT